MPRRTKNTSLQAVSAPAIENRIPLFYPPVHFVRFSGPALAAGVETHRIEGREVHVYSAAKTIADCFKYRNKIGLDVALEALNDAWRNRRVSMKEIDRFARVCRVHNVMRPYLEAMTASSARQSASHSR